MKNKYQLLSYIFIFFAGYYSNFLFSINSSYLQPLSVSEAGAMRGAGNRNTEIDNNTSLSVVSSDKKIVEPNPRSVVAPAVATEPQSLRPEELSAIHDELAMLRDYRMQAEINKHNEYLRSIGGNTVEALDNNFKRESVDSVWAKDKETLINNVINQNEHLSKLPQMASECRSKQCKFSVLSNDQFYLEKLSESLGKIIADHQTSFSTYSIVIDDKTHTTNVYFNRN